MDRVPACAAVSEGVAVNFVHEVGGAVEGIEEEIRVDIPSVGEVADQRFGERFIRA